MTFPDLGPIVTFDFRQALLQSAYDRLIRLELDWADPENAGLRALIDELREALGTVEIAELEAQLELE
jgi:hypothetical protein